jgi:hypothetical protein
MARYIDADALIAQIEGNTGDTWGRGLGRSWWAHSVMLKDNIVNLIRNAPTADVAPSKELFTILDSLEKVNRISANGIEVRWDNTNFYLISKHDIAEFKKKYMEGNNV